MEELELFTTKELIYELGRRSTFVGVIIYSKNENKNNESHGAFEVMDSTGGNAAKLMTMVLDKYESGEVEKRYEN